MVVRDWVTGLSKCQTALTPTQRLCCVSWDALIDCQLIRLCVLNQTWSRPLKCTNMESELAISSVRHLPRTSSISGTATDSTFRRLTMQRATTTTVTEDYSVNSRKNVRPPKSIVTMTSSLRRKSKGKSRQSMTWVNSSTNQRRQSSLTSLRDLKSRAIWMNKRLNRRMEKMSLQRQNLWRPSWNSRKAIGRPV